jgi:hypothetical protein
MPPSDDPFYARIPTLSDAELFTYIRHYSHYKVEAVHAAIAELRTRGLEVSHHTVSEIDRYFTRLETQHTRLATVAPRWLRWLSYTIFTLGIGSAVLIYVTADPPPRYPLGYDPFASKTYVRDLERYGGKINILAVEFRQWLARLWRGQNLAYPIAGLTVLLAALVWFLGSPAAAHRETQAEHPQAPEDDWS